MTRIIADISVSTDDPDDRRVLREGTARSGAVGAGTPLFTGGAPRTLVQRSVSSTATAPHLTYDISR